MRYSSEQKKWRSIAGANPDGFVNYRLRIPDLMGQDVPFRYNFAQRLVTERIREIHKTGKPVRLWVLKFRRAGCTSAMSARGYAHLYGSENARIAVIAHEEFRAKEILDNYRIYDRAINNRYPELELLKAKDNIFGLKFEASNSQVLIGTANNPMKVRGDGVHWLDGSEAAHWYNQFHKVMKEIGPVVPVLPGSQVVLETTGSLIGSEPYEHWLQAKQKKNEYEVMFLNWRDDPAMAIPFASDKEKHEFFDKIMQLEPRLLEKCAFYKLTPEQIHMAWNQFFFQSENDYNYWCREFPFSEQEAWSAGGDSYFGTYEIIKSRPEKPIATYVLEQHYIRRLFKDPGELKRVDEVDNYDIRPNIKIWAAPKKGSRYVIGGDSSYGDAGGDYSAAYLIDMITREMVASYHGLLRPDEAACIMVSLCRIYNNALAAPETNPAGGGYEALNCIQRLGYHNIYSWRRRDSQEGIESSRALGWWTHNRSRPLMLGELRKMFIDVVRGKVPDAGSFRDEALIREMATFGMRPDGTPGANANCKDDRVIACAIAHQVANDETYCTRDDQLYQYSRSMAPKADPAELLVKRDPNQVVAQFMDPGSNIARNRFEI